MTPEIVTALLALAGTVLGSLMGAKLTTHRIEQLEKKVEKHNLLMERMALMERDMKAASASIEELRERWQYEDGYF